VRYQRGLIIWTLPRGAYHTCCNAAHCFHFRLGPTGAVASSPGPREAFRVASGTCRPAGFGTFFSALNGKERPGYTTLIFMSRYAA
jgi:hypothetical protein